MSTIPQRASQPFALGSLTLRNRIVGAPHGRGMLDDGLALPADADYWRRVAAGGAAMVTVGGTVTAPESTWRRRIVTEAWREDGIPGLALRAEAIRSEGAVAACQLVHLGRETTGAEMWYPPVAPSAVRSPREPTRPRALSGTEIDEVIEGFRVSTVNAAQAGFQVVELHAAHAYLLAQFLSPSTNRRPGVDSVAARAGIVDRISAAIRRSAPELILGIRLSIDGEGEGGFSLDGLCELLPAIAPLVDYMSVTVGVRTTYVRDMATTEPPLLGAIDRLRHVVDGPLLVSQAFRRADSIEGALAAGADLVGVARPLIADPEFPAKVLSGRAEEVRPCVSCNEDCRAFDPVLLCSVNPDLGPSREGPRPAVALLARSGARTRPRRIAIVGAGPAGLECAISLPPEHEVVVFDEGGRLGGHLRIATSAPNRRGWQSLLDFYERAIDRAENVEVHLGSTADQDLLAEFDHVVAAVGSHEVLPEVPGMEHAIASSRFIGERSPSSAGDDLVILDDGFGWWPCASAVETGIAAGWQSITVLTPATSFGGRLPPEGHVQLMARLRGAPLEIRSVTGIESITRRWVTARNVLSGQTTELAADLVVVVGERRARAWEPIVPAGPGVHVIGDAVVPRRVHHAIAEGRATARLLSGAVRGLSDQREDLAVGDRR
ncbi:MAG TPA: FAD-dependent oxidoreductase [Solirubrobacteraceae bacterium]|nr:FAD-dependent oxidoreductase [Solirubrobacteraceae bacterium]